MPWFPKYLEDLNECISRNEIFLKQMSLEIAQDWDVAPDPTQWYRCNYQDLDKVRSTLKQLVREWSIEGEKERKQSFMKILNQVDEVFAGRDKRSVNVLVTGCGLGRLVLEFVDRGYHCQGNEFSYHMLLMSNYMLNHIDSANRYEVSPFIHKISHQVNRENITRSIRIPDFNPMDIFADPSQGKGELMSMCAGSFTDLYGPLDLMSSETYTADEKLTQFRQYNESRFDLVVTCFFLDTAHNIIEYLKTIDHCLKPDGVWVNFGPLLWHFENDDGETQANGETVPLKGLELTREDLVELCKSMGFEFVKYENDIPTEYGSDIHSLGQFGYKCEFWVCRKSAKAS